DCPVTRTGLSVRAFRYDTSILHDCSAKLGGRTRMKNQLWVVYKKTIGGHPSGMNVVCRQSEWDAMVLSKPGLQTLVQDAIASEGEAERLARRAYARQRRAPSYTLIQMPKKRAGAQRVLPTVKA